MSLTTRRKFISGAALSITSAGFAQNKPDKNWLIPAKAKRIIFLTMVGGPSQLDLFDYKPELTKMYGKELPDSIRKGQRLTTMTSNQEKLLLAPSKYNFRQHGDSGAWISELLPWTAKIADELCIVKSVTTEQINHDPAITFLQSGDHLPGRPSLGSWLSYGLGKSSQSLPDYVSTMPGWSSKLEAQALYQRLWGSGMLSSKYQGIVLRNSKTPVLYLNNPDGINRDARKMFIANLNELNRHHLKIKNDLEIESRIQQYELAQKMQSSIPELMDISKETKSVLDFYGPEVNKPDSFANHCLMARRMVERGVRMVQIFHRGWDQHFNLEKDLPKQCLDIDRACYGLITDLKSRGLLKDTLVVWGGEFGRTSYCQGRLLKVSYGRDHHPKCNTMWLAGGGIKQGISHGETDDLGYNVASNPVPLERLHATILNRMGIDHEKLSIRHKGLNVRLTGVERQKIVKELCL